MRAARCAALALLLLPWTPGCGRGGDPPPAAGRPGTLPGERPAVVLLVAERLAPEAFAAGGALAEFAAQGTRMANAYGRFDEPAACRADLLGLPGATLEGAPAGSLDACLGVAGYRVAEPRPADLVAHLAGPGVAFATVAVEGAEAAAMAVGALDAAGLAERTLVALVSLRGRPSAAPFSEEDLRVALVLRLPGRLPAGQERPQVVAHPDLAATLLDLVGVAASLGPGSEGQSFARVLTKQPHLWRGYVFARRTAPPAGADIAWVRSTDWRLVWREGAGSTLSWVREDPTRGADDLGRPGAAAVAAELGARLDAWLGR